MTNSNEQNKNSTLIDYTKLILGNFRNDKQQVYNVSIGKYEESFSSEKFCSVTLSVGIDYPRMVNFSIKRPDFDRLMTTISKGNRIKVYFYPTSKRATGINGKWFTNNCIIDVEKLNSVDNG